jgi:nucleotidyltransferase substrate binding protein (TIGR01987 family)
MGDFRKALTRLRDMLARDMNDEAVRDSVIQRFEFTYEMAWKTAKLWLEAKEVRALNPKDVLTAAVGQELILDGNLWSELHRNRNITSHTYQEETAKAVAGFIRAHAVAAFESLLSELEKRPPA